MEILMVIIIFVLGLCFGSFVNMLIYRTAINYKLESRKFKVESKNRSFCDYCGKQLNWYENIPVFSWLILKGKTKCCHKKLPLSYPLVELITGIIFVINSKFPISNFQFLNKTQFLFYLISLIIIVFLVFSTVFDLKYMILPDFSTVILIIVAIIGIIIGRPQESPVQFILSAILASGFLLFLNLITKGKGMGMGDVKLAIFMGLFLGFPKTIIAFYAAFIIGAIIGILLMIFKKAKKKTQIPFGPFLILGTFISWWWGEMIVKILSSKF
jgi:prepilin signal peptidase PulO-like enzyme (type II secretory pathway)